MTFTVKTRDVYGNTASGDFGANKMLMLWEEPRDRTGEISSISVSAGGTNYVTGGVRIPGGVGFTGTFTVDGAGAVASVVIGSYGSGYVARESQLYADLYHVGTGELQTGL